MSFLSFLFAPSRIGRINGPVRQLRSKSKEYKCCFPDDFVNCFGIGFNFRFDSSSQKSGLENGTFNRMAICDSGSLLRISRCPIGQKTPRLRRAKTLMAGVTVESDCCRPRDSSEALPLVVPVVPYGAIPTNVSAWIKVVSRMARIVVFSVVGNRSRQSTRIFR